MIFYDGFMFKSGEKMVEKHLNVGEYKVAGFSYGAIKALREALQSDKRIDTLQLFSPAFFNESSQAFIKTQLIGFRRDRESYRDSFFKNSFYPLEVNSSYIDESGSLQDLKDLLLFDWRGEDLQAIKDRGTEIEVFLGGKDRIIDVEKAKEFFKEFGTICYIKDGGHTLF